VRDRISRTIAAAVLLIATAPALAAGAQTYVVRSGDTLWSIARRHGVSVERLASANRLANPDALQLGQQLIIPSSAGEGAAQADPGGPRRLHVVAAGDTLWSISRRYEVPVQTLVDVNRLSDPDALRLGQSLVIPWPASRSRPSGTAGVREAPPPANPVAVRRALADGRIPSRGAKWGSALLATASRQVGVRYRWGGMSPAGFDCSGFIGYVMRAVGVSMPRTTYAMWTGGQVVPRDELRVGDIVFFTTTRRGPSHAGIFIGNNQFIHSSSGFGRVTVTSMDYRYYKPRYLGARRF
jgi:cell wall-associated NlpC family hydrolase